MYLWLKSWWFSLIFFCSTFFKTAFSLKSWAASSLNTSTTIHRFAVISLSMAIRTFCWWPSFAARLWWKQCKSYVKDVQDRPRFPRAARNLASVPRHRWLVFPSRWRPCVGSRPSVHRFFQDVSSRLYPQQTTDFVRFALRDGCCIFGRTEQAARELH